MLQNLLRFYCIAVKLEAEKPFVVHVYFGIIAVVKSHVTTEYHPSAPR